MKISIIGNNLTALVLAKVLLKKKIRVDLFYEENTTKNIKFRCFSICHVKNQISSNVFLMIMSKTM